MKNKTYYLLVIFIALVSCTDQKQNNKAIIDLMKNNYQFNSRRMNSYRAEYIRLKNEQPIKYRSTELDSLYTDYEHLITSINEYLKLDSKDLNNLKNESNEFIIRSKQIVNNRDDYSIQATNLIKLNAIESPEIQLLILKNEITIAMSYPIEFQISRHTPGLNMQHIEVKAKPGVVENNQLTINLSSDFLYPEKFKQDILVNKIEHNGVTSKLPFSIQDNYNFGDIRLDSLEQGDYYLSGSVIHYSRDGEIELPFETSFNVE